MKEFNDWFKNNWFTLLGVFIVLMLVLYYSQSVGKVVKQEVEECIEHYDSEISRCDCVNSYEPTFDFEELNINWSGES